MPPNPWAQYDDGTTPVATDPAPAPAPAPEPAPQPAASPWTQYDDGAPRPNDPYATARKNLTKFRLFGKTNEADDLAKQIGLADAGLVHVFPDMEGTEDWLHNMPEVSDESLRRDLAWRTRTLTPEELKARAEEDANTPRMSNVGTGELLARQAEALAMSPIAGVEQATADVTAGGRGLYRLARPDTETPYADAFIDTLRQNADLQTNWSPAAQKIAGGVETVANIAPALIPGVGEGLMAGQMAGQAADTARLNGGTYGQQLASAFAGGATALVAPRAGSLLNPEARALTQSLIDKGIPAPLATRIAAAPQGAVSGEAFNVGNALTTAITDPDAGKREMNSGESAGTFALLSGLTGHGLYDAKEATAAAVGERAAQETAGQTVGEPSLSEVLSRSQQPQTDATGLPPGWKFGPAPTAAPPQGSPDVQVRKLAPEGQAAEAGSPLSGIPDGQGQAGEGQQRFGPPADGEVQGRPVEGDQVPGRREAGQPGTGRDGVLSDAGSNPPEVPPGVRGEEGQGRVLRDREQAGPQPGNVPEAGGAGQAKGSQEAVARFDAETAAGRNAIATHEALPAAERPDVLRAYTIARMKERAGLTRPAEAAPSGPDATAAPPGTAEKAGPPPGGTSEAARPPDAGPLPVRGEPGGNAPPGLQPSVGRGVAVPELPPGGAPRDTGPAPGVAERLAAFDAETAERRKTIGRYAGDEAYRQKLLKGYNLERYRARKQLVKEIGDQVSTPTNVDAGHDVPDLAGMSTDRKTVEIDQKQAAALRQLPVKGRDGSTRNIDATPFLERHERTEQPLMDKGMPYEQAHKVATAAERAAVEKAGIDWNSYEQAMLPHISAAERGRGHDTNVAADLDRRPYTEEGQGLPSERQGGQDGQGAQPLSPKPEPGLDEHGRGVESRMAAELAKPDARDRYNAIKSTEKGRIINTDDVRELSPDMVGRENRTKNAAATHGPASAFSKQLFAEAVAKPPSGPKAYAMFLGGGGGSGKTHTSKALLGELRDRADFVYDTTLANTDRTMQNIDQVLASGRRVAVAFVHAPFDEAVKNAIDRAKGDGRVVPLKQLAEDHVHAQETVLKVAEKYRNDRRVSVKILDNTGRHIALSDLGLVERNRYTQGGDDGAAIQRLYEQGKEILREQAPTTPPDIVRAFDSGVAGRPGLRAAPDQRPPAGGGQAEPPERGDQGQGGGGEAPASEVGKRENLALPSEKPEVREAMKQVDANRENPVRSDDERDRLAAEGLHGDYDGTLAKIRAKLAAGTQLDDVETRQAVQFSDDLYAKDPVEAAKFFDGYRTTRGEQARGLRAGADPLEPPVAKAKRAVREMLMTPSQKVDFRASNALRAGDRAGRARIIDDHAKQIPAVKARLRKLTGIDPDTIQSIQQPSLLARAQQSSRGLRAKLASERRSLYKQFNDYMGSGGSGSTGALGGEAVALIAKIVANHIADGALRFGEVLAAAGRLIPAIKRSDSMRQAFADAWDSERAKNPQLDESKTPAEQRMQEATDRAQRLLDSAKGRLDDLKAKNPWDRLEEINQRKADKAMPSDIADKVRPLLDERRAIMREIRDRDRAYVQNAERLLSGLKTIRADKWDAVYEWYRSGLHTSFHLPLYKVSTDGVFGAMHYFAERPLQALINKAIGNKDGTSFEELKHAYAGMLPAMKRGAANALESWAHENNAFAENVSASRTVHNFERGLAPDTEGPSEFHQRPIIQNAALKHIRWNIRAIGAAQAFAESAIAHTEAGAQAFRRAVDADGKPLTGDALAQHMANEMGDLGSDSWHAAMAVARDLTFTAPNAPGRWITGLKNIDPYKAKTMGGYIARRATKEFSRYLFPFVTLPTNIIIKGAQYSPLASAEMMGSLAKHAIGKAFGVKGWEYTKGKFSEQAARQIIGWGLFGLADHYMTDENGDPQITGFNEWNPKAADIPAPPAHSVKIGSHWVDYAKILGPYGHAIGTAIDMARAMTDMKNGQPALPGNKAGKTPGSQGKAIPGALTDLGGKMLDQVRDETFLRTVHDLFALTEGGHAVAKWAGNFTASWVPTMFKQAAGAAQETPESHRIKSDGFWNTYSDTIRQRLGIPDSGKFPPVDLFGDDIRKDTYGSPATTYAARLALPPSSPAETGNDDLKRAIGRWNEKNPTDQLLPSEPDYRMRSRGDTTPLNDAQYHDFLVRGGTAAATELHKLAAEGKLNLQDPKQKDRDTIERVVETSYKIERAKVKVGQAKAARSHAE